MEKIHLDKLNVLQGIVKTTIPLEEYEYNSLVDKLEKKYKKEIILKKIVDPEILGGIYVRIGNDVLDGSVKTRLDDLEKLMLTTE
ncbi:ATP synthase subunit delta, sodium ion specific domain protein [Clostridium celatum DSM 1785]|uniref:ATP synthase subunit delta, sodium ion specific domain protein n=2 Tax=Clostridium celatum TaxID=36834 RepID=L1QI58_9CLOT|nr:ATP synthase subunit delta, sodium ion specific domain protein [Clostridium celatum DSM 1785]